MDVESQPKYQRWLYQRQVALSLAAGQAPDHIRFEDEEKQDPSAQSADDLEYRCRKCRRMLATTPYTIPHEPQAPRTQAPISSLAQLSSNDIPQSSSTTSPQCGHIFVDPLSWMRPELSQGKLEGRLECPNEKCGSNVGKYAWQGMRCSCGVWVIPAVTLQKGRVDVVKKVAVRGVPGAGIRLPPGAARGGRENL
jgi:dual specificity phosphatase 12